MHSVAATDVVFVVVTLRYTELHRYYKLSDTLRLLCVHLRYIQRHLVVCAEVKKKALRKVNRGEENKKKSPVHV